MSILPLARFLEYGGEQLAFYVGKDLGDLIRVTLSKYVHSNDEKLQYFLLTLLSAVEATLAIILLVNCE